MARTRRGKPINGWLAIDKPPGMTSTGVVTQVKRLTGAAKVGHGGTLDPLATGVLPIAFGEATKTVQYVMDSLKSYRFTIRWGEERDTDDAEGTVTATSDHRPSEDAITAALPAFIGDIDQVPPRYSAIKIDGRRAYDIARASGEEPELKSRTIQIRDFRLVRSIDADHAEFEVRSGKGAYMRALARDLSRALGTVGHIHALRRTACGPFREGMAISLEKLGEVGQSTPVSAYLLPIATALDDIPALALTEQEAHHLSSGQPVSLLPVASRTPLVGLAAGDTVRAMSAGRVVALARIEDHELRPVRVLNL